MSRRRLLFAVVVIACVGSTARPAAAACPIAGKPTIAAGVPDAIKIGEPFVATIAGRRYASGISVCFDGDTTVEVSATDVTSDGGDTRVKVTIPATLGQQGTPLSADMHTLRVQFTDSAGAIVVSQHVFPGGCPVKPKSTIALGVDPAIQETDQQLTVSVQRAASGTAVKACFDDDADKIDVNAADVKNAGTTTTFPLTIPSNDKRPRGALSPRDHTLTIQLANEVGQIVTARQVLVHKPSLTGVGIIPLTEHNRELRVALTGTGFDGTTPGNNKIVLNGLESDVCWDAASCNAVPTAIRGEHATPLKIVLSKIPAAVESGAEFQVCFGDTAEAHCSARMSDAEASSARMVVLLLSLLVTGLVIGLVIFLVWLRRGSIMIWGQQYVVTTLLLDRETDTYSLSKLQFYIWTIVAVFGYAYLSLSRNLYQYWPSLPAIPAGLPGIVGIAAGAAVGAQVVTQINGPKGAGKVHPSLSDLITSGDVVAAERVQFLVWTFVGAVGFFLVIAQLDPRVVLDLPPVPESLLTISGISAFGYLGGKLARNAGPVINELIVRKGSDPDATAGGTTTTPGTTGTTTTTSSPATTPGTAGSTTAPTTTTAATGGSTATPPTTTPATGGSTTAPPATTPATGGSTTAPPATTPGAGASTTPPASQGPFEIIELRGRTLSQDATFKISTGPESMPDDVQLMFDKLEPSPKDDKHIQKPRVVEQDPDAGTDMTLAKRLMLVVRLDKTVEKLFTEETTHTITVTNPDSQKVAYKFTVPAAQKP